MFRNTRIAALAGLLLIVMVTVFLALNPGVVKTTTGVQAAGFLNWTLQMSDMPKHLHGKFSPVLDGGFLVVTDGVTVFCYDIETTVLAFPKGDPKGDGKPALQVNSLGSDFLVWSEKQKDSSTIQPSLGNDPRRSENHLADPRADFRPKSGVFLSFVEADMFSLNSVDGGEPIWRQQKYAARYPPSFSTDESTAFISSTMGIPVAMDTVNGSVIWAAIPCNPLGDQACARSYFDETVPKYHGSSGPFGCVQQSLVSLVSHLFMLIQCLIASLIPTFSCIFISYILVSLHSCLLTFLSPYILVSLHPCLFTSLSLYILILSLYICIILSQSRRVRRPSGVHHQRQGR